MTTDPGDYKARDAYFTLPSVARTVWAQALRHCRRIGVDPGDLHWIEPSAGAGVFLDTAPRCVRHLTAYDIHPMADGIVRADFLHTTPPDDGRQFAIIGNPPFGVHRLTMMAFVNHALIHWRARFVAFLVPARAKMACARGNPVGSIVHAHDFPPAAALYQTAAGAPYRAATHSAALIWQGISKREWRPPQTADFATYFFHTGLSPNKPKPDLHRCLEYVAKHGVGCCAIGSNKPVVYSADKIPRTLAEFERRDFGGSFNIIYPRRLDGDTLVKRMCSIDWSVWQARSRADGTPMGTISNPYIVAAYNAQFGGGFIAPEQSQVFA